MSFEPGFDKKSTSDPVTFDDTNGSYKESPGGVWLDTVDDRYVRIRCGLVPVGSGGPGDVGVTNGQRDDCGDGFEHHDLDAAALRTLGASVAPAAESGAVVAAINEYNGDDRMTFPMGQFDGVIQAANLAPLPDGPMTTQLSIIHGVYPPRAADSIPTNLAAAVIPSGSRFRVRRRHRRGDGCRQ